MDDWGISVRKTFVLIACGVLVSACSNIPGLGGDPAKVSLESMPPGANASLSSGGSCRTPCTLPAPDKAGDYNVTFGLAGHTTQTIPIKVTTKKENWYSSEIATVEPNPVTATMQPTGAAGRKPKS
jgi:PEGA domain